MPILVAIFEALVAALAWVARIGPLLARMWAWLKSTKWGAWMMFMIFTYMGGIIGRIVTWLGITFAFNQIGTPYLRDLVAGWLLGLPPAWVQLLALTKIDQALTVILSAIAMATANKIQVKRRRDSWQTPL